MAVKTESDLLAACASGNPITESMMTDVVNTIFSRGSGGGSTSIVFLVASNENDTVENMLSSADITLSANTLIVILNRFSGSVGVTVYDYGSGEERYISIPPNEFALVCAFHTDATMYYYPLSSFIS